MNRSRTRHQNKDHRRILETFFDTNSNDGSNDVHTRDTGESKITGSLGDTAVGHGSTTSGPESNSKESSAEPEQNNNEGLNDLEDDMENEVTTLLGQLGSGFSPELDQQSKLPIPPASQANVLEDSLKSHDNYDGTIIKSGIAGPNSDVDRGSEQTNSESDEDILDLITNILQDPLPNKTNSFDAQKERLVDNNDRNNTKNVSSTNTNVLPVISNTSKDTGTLNKKISPYSSGEKISRTNGSQNLAIVDRSNTPKTSVFNDVSEGNSKASSNQVKPSKGKPDNLALGSSDIDITRTPAHKQGNHQTIKYHYRDNSARSRTDKSFGVSQGITEVKLRLQRQKETGVFSESETKQQSGMIKGNDTDVMLRYQNSPTPSSQLLQSFPGAVSYNVKLTTEESPPGKVAKVKPSNQAKSPNNQRAFSKASSIERNRNLALNERQGMTERIFEVGQAAIEAGKNMIYAEESHADKNKIYDIVGTRNVTSVGKYLITIGEELLKRRKALMSKKTSSLRQPLWSEKSASNFQNKSEKLTRILPGRKTQSDWKKINMSASSPISKPGNSRCGIGERHENASLRGKVRAGLFTPTGPVKDGKECARRCCNNAKCDMALVVNYECYTVECFHWTLCQIVPCEGSSEFKSEVIGIVRLQSHNHNSSEIEMNHDFQNFYGQIDKSRPKITPSPSASLPQAEKRKIPYTVNTSQSKVPSKQMHQSENLKKPLQHQFDYAEQKDYRTRMIQKKEMTCQNFLKNGTGELKPGSWKLSGSTNSSDKCVDLCCSQNGCDLAFQIGEACYALACYNDSRGCNPLAIPVGLSYLRLKRRQKLASKSVTDSMEKLNKADDVSKRTRLPKNNHMSEKHIAVPQNKDILSSLSRVSVAPGYSELPPLTQQSNSSVDDDEKLSNLCSYSVKRDMFFSAGHNAGEFKRAKHVDDISTCGYKCCNSTACDVAYMVENICFLVKCKDMISCELVTVKNLEYSSSVILVTRKSDNQINSDSKNESVSKFSAVSQVPKKLIKNNDEADEKALIPKELSEQNVMPNDTEAGSSLGMSSLKKTPSQASDFDVVLDNDNDDDVLDDADNDFTGTVYDFDDDGDDDDENVVDGIQDSKHVSGNNDYQHKYKTNNTSENLASVIPNKSSSAVISQVKNSSFITFATKNETSGKQIVGSNSGSKSSWYGSHLNHSSNGVHENKENKTTSTRYNHEISGQEFIVHSNSHFANGTKVNASHESKAESEGSVGSKRPSTTTSSLVSKEHQSKNKSIHGVKTKEKVQNVSGRLEKEGVERSEVSLEPQFLKDKGINGETYVIYDDADNGAGVSHLLRNTSSRNVSHFQERERDTQFGNTISSNIGKVRNSTNKNLRMEISAKMKDINKTSVTVGKKPLGQFTITERNSSQNGDTFRSTSNNTDERFGMRSNATSYRHKSSKNQQNGHFANVNQTFLRQNDIFGDIIPKIENDEKASNTNVYLEAEKWPYHKSHNRGRNYKGDEILKPEDTKEGNSPEKNEEDGYPFDYLQSDKERFSEKSGDSWPWEVIPLDGSFTRLSSKNSGSVENQDMGMMDESNNNINEHNSSNTVLPSSKRLDFQAKNNSERETGSSRKVVNQTLANPKSTTSIPSVSRQQLHSKVKAVLKTYYRDKWQENTFSGGKPYNGSGVSRKEDYKNLWVNKSSANHFGSSSGIHQLKNKDGFSDKNKTKMHINSEIYKNNSPITSNNIHYMASSDAGKGNEGDEDPYLILASAKDVKEFPGQSEPSAFSTTHSPFSITHNHVSNLFTDFVKNDTPKVENTGGKVKRMKKVIKDNANDIHVSRTKKYSWKTEANNSTVIKVGTPRSSRKHGDFQKKLDKINVSASHVSKSKDDGGNKKNIASKKLDSFRNETSRYQNMINRLENTYLAILSKESRNTSHKHSFTNSKKIDNAHRETGSDKDVVPVTKELMEKGEQDHDLLMENQTLSPNREKSDTSKEVLDDIDELLENDKTTVMARHSSEAIKKNVTGQTNNKGLKDRRNHSVSAEPYVPKEAAEDVRNQNTDFKNISMICKNKPDEKEVAENGNKTVVLDTMVGSNKEVRPKIRKTKSLSSKPNLNSGTKMNETKDQTTALDSGIGNDNVSSKKLKNANFEISSRRNKSDVLNVDTNRTQHLTNGSRVKISKKFHSNVLTDPGHEKLLRNENFNGNSVPKYNKGGKIDGISEKDTLQTTKLKNQNATVFSKSDNSQDSARVEIFDNGHFLSGEEDNIENKHKGSQRIAVNKSAPSDKSDYSKLGRILFDDTTETNEQIENDKYKIHENRESSGSTQNTSDIIISPGIIKSYDIHPWALNGTENYSSTNGEIEEVDKNPVQLTVDEKKSKLRAHNQYGDEIPRPDEKVIKTQPTEKKEKDSKNSVKNKKNVANEKHKNSATQIAKWGKGVKHSLRDGSLENSSPVENMKSKLSRKDKEGDFIIKPNHFWKSEDEIEGRVISREREHEASAKDEYEENTRGFESTNNHQKNAPKTTDPWLSIDEIDDPYQSSGIGTGDDADTGVQNEEKDKNYQRNNIPTSNETLHDNKKTIGMLLFLFLFNLKWDNAMGLTVRTHILPFGNNVADVREAIVAIQITRCASSRWKSQAK